MFRIMILFACCIMMMSSLTTPVRAGSRDAAIAAGIIGGVIGTAIIMQQNARPAAGREYRQRRKAAKPDNSGQASNGKDPFAGTQAPAGYATPVVNKQ
jgi:hypothetical protein